jgi:hypothetical protein
VASPSLGGFPWVDLIVTVPLGPRRQVLHWPRRTSSRYCLQESVPGRRAHPAALKAYTRTQWCRTGRRFLEETGEVVVAGSGSWWWYLHRRGRPPDPGLSNRSKVPLQSSRSIRTRRITPYGVVDLLRRGRLLGSARSHPGLAAFDSGDPKRCGWSQGLETRADDVAAWTEKGSGWLPAPEVLRSDPLSISTMGQPCSSR